MKKLLLLSVLMGSVSFAQFANAHGRPCKPVFKACKAAGVAKADMKDCIKKTLAGESVPGVTVSPEDLKTCQDAKAAKGK